VGRRVGVEEAGGTAETRIVDQAVDGQTPGLDGVEQPARRGGIGEVVGQDGRGGPRKGQFVGQRSEGGLAARRQDQVPAVVA
jgi:hypothetical protein